jgi:phosphocarrier protein
MGLMTLAAARGTKLVIQVEGDDATAAVDAIQSLAEDNFNEA